MKAWSLQIVNPPHTHDTLGFQYVRHSWMFLRHVHTWQGDCLRRVLSLSELHHRGEDDVKTLKIDFSGMKDVPWSLNPFREYSLVVLWNAMYFLLLHYKGPAVFCALAWVVLGCKCVMCMPAWEECSPTQQTQCWHLTGKHKRKKSHPA